MGFVTGFRGRRDGYQVPIALAEAGMLDAFVTDHFVGPVERLAARILPSRHAEKLLARGDDRIPAEKVVRLRATALREAVHLARGGDPNALYAQFDPIYGERMAQLANRHGSDILAYSAYAEAAFAGTSGRSHRRILFQYHPHIALEQRILRDDMDRFGDAQRESRHDSGLTPHPVRVASDDSWKLADEIVCASSFTKQSLVEVGADPAKIRVIPYGIDLPAPPVQPIVGARFRALYVGSGLHRKGLHHLLTAWRNSGLATSGDLIIVARAIESDLMHQVRETPGVEYRPGVSAAELDALYASASLFVMPSLVEGFGQVYLEALAHGLPVLGTANTCLPDLGEESDGIFLAPVGDVDALTEQLRELSSWLPGDTDIRERARGVAERHSWSRFRAGIVALARDVPGGGGAA